MTRSFNQISKIAFSLIETVAALALLGVSFATGFQLWYPIMNRMHEIHKNYDILYCMDLVDTCLLDYSLPDLENTVNLYLNLNSKTKDFFWSHEEPKTNSSNLINNDAYDTYHIELKVSSKVHNRLHGQYMHVYIYKNLIMDSFYDQKRKEKLLVAYPFYQYAK